MDCNIKPIFIISMPRSGSTLLQKILMTSPDVSSVSEPWINLPLSDIFDPHTKSWYNKTVALRALSDFTSTLNHNGIDLHEALGHFVVSMYSCIAEAGTTYFIDKTRRYYGIVPFLKTAFPNAKYIYLLRSPAEVLSSKIIKNDNRLPPLKYAMLDTITATKHIVEAINTDPDSFTVKYTDLTDDTETTIRTLESYLSIKTEVTKIAAVELRGTFGDQRARSSSVIERSAQSDWTRTVSTLCRYLVFKYVLNNIPAAYYDLIGSDYTKDIDSLKAAQKRLFRRPRLGAGELLRSVA